MNQLSAVIISYNEETNIGACIDSVKGVADEVVVVDSYSTDKTREVALAKGARVIEHAFEGHIQQKNWARLQATNDYVLSLDADEQLSEELRTSLLEAKQHFTADGYSMNRLNFYCGKPIKTCGWYPDRKLRLWNRNKGEWKGVNPHDKFELNSNATEKFLTGDIWHNTYPDKAALLSQVEKFANISAQQLKQHNILFLVFKMIFSAPFRFIKNYFFKLGFTEGKAGWEICYHQSREVFLKYLRALALKLTG
jgi:glycosyltransferase involved in cell wall biosynthesis